MALRDVIERDQVKVFGDPRGLAEPIVYIDRDGISFDCLAMVERESTEPDRPAGYGAAVGRDCMHVWIPRGGETGRRTITIGVDRVKVRWRQGDADFVETRITAILPDSDSAFHVECTR